MPSKLQNNTDDKIDGNMTIGKTSMMAEKDWNKNADRRRNEKY